MKQNLLSISCLTVLLVLGLTCATLEAQKPKYPLPTPKFEFHVERNVMIPMRDGVRLSTDLYFPKNAGDTLPVILIRTPYDKDLFYKGAWGTATKLFAGQGYVVAVQDCRGKYASEGIFIVSKRDGEDGYDSVEWIAAQSWSNGKVGMMGVSYLGTVQWMAAREKPPHLVCIAPTAAAGRWFEELPYQGGAFVLAFMLD